MGQFGSFVDCATAAAADCGDDDGDGDASISSAIVIFSSLNI